MMIQSLCYRPDLGLEYSYSASVDDIPTNIEDIPLSMKYSKSFSVGVSHDDINTVLSSWLKPFG